MLAQHYYHGIPTPVNRVEEKVFLNTPAQPWVFVIQKAAAHRA